MVQVRFLVAVVMALVVVVAGASAAEARTKTAFAGPPGAPPAGTPKAFDSNEFYRERVTINVGDTISWQMRGFHTVTFSAPGQRPPPLVVPDPANPYSGYADAAGTPFWFNGQPSLVLNPQAAARTPESSTEGTQFRNSGLPPPEGRPPPYKLRFNKTGTYRYLCVVHPGMRGSVKVVERGEKVPSAREDRAAARAEFARDARRARRLNSFRPRGRKVVAGHDRGAVALFKFYPGVRSVKVGQAVNFSIGSRSEIHTVSFGPRRYRANQARNLITPRLPPPPGGPPTLVFNPIVFFSSDPPPALPPHTGRNHGNGFLNTGVLDKDPQSPNPASAKIRFTRKGTFEFECLIHPGMRGKIRVRAAG